MFISHFLIVFRPRRKGILGILTKINAMSSAICLSFFLYYIFCRYSFTQFRFARFSLPKYAQTTVHCATAIINLFRESLLQQSPKIQWCG